MVFVSLIMESSCSNRMGGGGGGGSKDGTDGKEAKEVRVVLFNSFISSSLCVMDCTLDDDDDDDKDDNIEE